jgi:hypothetical protein
VNPKEKVKSLSTIFDDMEQLEIGPNLSKEDYKKLINKIVYMLTLAYDKGFEDGNKNE